MRERELLVNAIMCPDGTVISSTHVHELVRHVQEDGRSYFVDGGTQYRRVGFSDKEYTDLAVYTDEPHSLIRERFMWTRIMDKKGKMLGKPETLLLKDLDDKHIENLCYYTLKNYPTKINKVFIDEHNWRKDENNKG